MVNKLMYIVEESVEVTIASTPRRTKEAEALKRISTRHIGSGEVQVAWEKGSCQCE